MEDIQTETTEEMPLIPLEPAKQYAHHYDKDTFEYLFKTDVDYDREASRRLGYNVPLLPACATLKRVPEYNENEIPVYSSHTEQQTATEQIPVFDEETGEITSYEEQEKIIDVLVEEWTIKPDFRKNFYKVDESLTVSEITTIGEQEGFYVVDKETGEDIKQFPDKYKIENSEVVKKSDEEYAAEQAQKERERISMLSLTAADVERAIYKAKGMDFEDVIAAVEVANEASTVSEEGTTPAIDIKALKIELKANNFYRGNPYIDAVGELLGFTVAQLDEFFETNDYTKLLPQEAVEDTPDTFTGTEAAE